MFSKLVGEGLQPISKYFDSNSPISIVIKIPESNDLISTTFDEKGTLIGFWYSLGENWRLGLLET